MLLSLLAAAHASTLTVHLWDEGHPSDSREWAELSRDRVILDTGDTRLRVRIRKRAAGGAVVRVERCSRRRESRCRTWSTLETLRLDYGVPDHWSYIEDDFVCGNQETVSILTHVEVRWLDQQSVLVR